MRNARFGRLSAVGVVVLMNGACAHDGASLPAKRHPSSLAGASAAASSNANSASPAMAPTPYSVDEIRAGNQMGTFYRYQLEKAGEPLRIKVLQFKAVTAETAEVQSLELDEEGREVRPAKIDKSTWDEIRRHAEFPRASLSIETGTIEVPAGKFDVDVYTVRTPKGDTMRFYFSKSYAGPPVLFSAERGGLRVMTQTLLERKAGGS